jgi:hypothetical protein
MNHSYESVKETMITRGIDVPESYIEKALREYGFDKFPESGLEDSGLDKLVKRATDIAHAEAQLIPRKAKRGYLPVPKIKKAKAKTSGNLDFLKEIAKEDLEKICRLGAVYTTATIAIPTGFRISDVNNLNAPNGNATAWILGTFTALLGRLSLYVTLSKNNPKLGFTAGAIDIATNLVSLFYEGARHAKKTAEERIEQGLPPDRFGY